MRMRVQLKCAGKKTRGTQMPLSADGIKHFYVFRSKQD
jgi:hypothetical protein